MSEEVMQEEQAADLARLTAMAETDTAGVLVAGAEQQPVTEINLADEISGLLTMLVNMGGPMFPSLKVIYTDEVIQSVGNAVEPVCKKRGWMQDGLGGKYKEEMLAAAIVAPLGFATWQGIKADIAARTKEHAVPLPQVGDMPGTGKVIIGAVEQ